MRKTLKSVAGLVLGLAFIVAVVTLIIVVVSLLTHPSEMPDEALVILGSAVGAIISAGVLWLLVEIADSLTLVNDRKLGL